MISVVRGLGAPVTDPEGNSATKISSSPTSSGTSAEMREVSCQTVSYRSSANSSSTSTVPKRAILPRSLRSRSTIMRFSARSLSDLVSWRAFALSSAGQRPLPMVPFIGRTSIRGPDREKNSSGDALTTW